MAGGQRVIAEFGIGLAAAVFLDAFVLRTVLVPSLMHLFGRASWWLPRAVDRRSRTSRRSRRPDRRHFAGGRVSSSPACASVPPRAATLPPLPGPCGHHHMPVATHQAGIAAVASTTAATMRIAGARRADQVRENIFDLRYADAD